MNPKLVLLLLVVLLSANCRSQTHLNVKRQKLKTITIDTLNENVLAFEMPNVIIYYKQEDIRNFIDSAQKNNSSKLDVCKVLFDTLKDNIHSILIKDINFSYDNVQRDSILKVNPVSTKIQQINTDLYFIAAELMLDGRSMIYSKQNAKFITKGLVAKREEQLYNSEDLLFKLPDGEIFYRVTVALGE